MMYLPARKKREFSFMALPKTANLKPHGLCKEHRAWGEGKENTHSIMPEWQQEHHLPSRWITTIVIALNLKQLKKRMKRHTRG